MLIASCPATLQWVGAEAPAGSLKPREMRHGRGLKRRCSPPSVPPREHLCRSARALSIEAALTKHGIGLIVPSIGGERIETRSPTSKLQTAPSAPLAVRAFGRHALLSTSGERAKAGRSRGL